MQGSEEGEERVGREFFGPGVPGDAMDGVGRGQGSRVRTAGQIIPEHLAPFSEGGPEKYAEGLFSSAGVERYGPAPES
jgi:hypothetical protein